MAGQVDGPDLCGLPEVASTVCLAVRRAGPMSGLQRSYRVGAP